MKGRGFACKEVSTAEECACPCEQAKILITLWQNDSGNDKPWTDPKFPWNPFDPKSTPTVDLHAIRSETGCSNDYSQIKHSGPPGNLTPRTPVDPKDLDPKGDGLFNGETPLLCCCQEKK